MNTTDMAVLPKSPLKQFFGPVGEARARYFSHTLVPPDDLEDLVNAITPSGTERRLVVLDGQPRMGKTWSALAAISAVLDRNPTLSFWTAGEDSRFLFPKLAKTVHQGLIRAREEFDAKRPSIVFLDDLFGTVRLRTLADSPGDEIELAALLNCDSEGHICNYLAPGSTLVLTGRATLLTAAEVLLNCRIRPLSRVRLFSRGIFRRKDGTIGGSFTVAQLDKIVARHACDGAAPTEAESQELLAPPPFPEVAAFSTRPPEIFRDQHVSDVFFGDDFDVLAGLISDLRKQNSPDALKKMCAAYVLEIAPGLVYLDASGYRALGVDGVLSRLSQDLALRPSRDSEGFGRVPSKHYIHALHNHFSKASNIETAAFAITQTATDPATIQIVLRGLLEQAIERLKPDALPAALASLEQGYPNLASLVERYPNALFDWELNRDTADRGVSDLVFKPGFCAALGWAVYRMRSLRNLAGAPAVDWLRSELASWFERWSMVEPERQELLLASYSTLTHWAIAMELHQVDGKDGKKVKVKHPQFLSELRSIIKALKGECSEKTQIVFDDEMTWAFTHRTNSPIERTGVVKTLRRTIVAEAGSTSKISNWPAVNRLFTLAWHNEWMERENQLKEEFNAWLTRHQQPASDTLTQQPDLLDLNLKYHWWHFMTQHNVWMRDWCFEPDPDAFEQNRPAAGSSDPAHNKLFWDLASIILRDKHHSEDQSYERRLRNILMLLGTRTARLPESCQVGKLFDNYLTGKTAAWTLVAIFELARQGYLASDCRHTSPTFNIWCQKIASDYSALLPDAWNRYRGELEIVTYLDLMPERWEDLRPAHW